METEILHTLLEDGLFAAMAAIGFSTISRTPRRCWFVCALAAAVGHVLRYLLMSPPMEMNIIPASLLASFAVGVTAVAFAPMVKAPADACLFPSLLPMIPGMYAYRAIEGLIACVRQYSGAASSENLYILSQNSITCVLTVFSLAIGATIPVFLFKRISYQATR